MSKLFVKRCLFSRKQFPDSLFFRLSEFAVIPTRGSPGSAGYDLSSAEAVVVPARGKAICPTDLSIACPPGTYGRIAPRSGLAWKNHIDVGAGVIDADYRGNVGVVLFNHSENDLKVEVGDRVAQLILERIEFAEVEEVQELDDTQRGTGGFGSTGMAQPDSKRAKSDKAEQQA
jgi:dUTP pyrophosphatase